MSCWEEAWLIARRPTFKLFKDGKEVDSMRGADPRVLEAKIREHYVVPEATEEGSTSVGSASVSSVGGYPDITSNIDPKNARILAEINLM